jgi:DNA-binding MarR family transcriptional regulator/GNAT superfamily N-acetyltransferase
LETVSRIRSFNRVVTERVGALNDHYLALDRPLGEARLLWEIGGGAEVRRLRARLGLDSGYLSRLIRSLEAQGLVGVSSSGEDGRVRTVELTPAGRAERALMDERSDELARSFLDPLSESQRERLVSAMAEVERLLTASLVEIVDVDPADADAQHCLREYFTELDHRFDAGFDPARSIAGVDDFRPPAGLFLVARLRGDPIGCGGLRFHGEEPPDIKRMWVAKSARGLGVGRGLLRELEQRATAVGASTVRLETNGALTEAIALYRSSGYAEVDAFNAEPYAHHWFEKGLTREPGSRVCATQRSDAQGSSAETSTRP